MATATNIIQALGGTMAAASLLGVPATTVSSWKKAGIPSWRMREIERVAAERGISLEVAA